MNCACDLQQKQNNKKNINIYTYTYIFEKPFDCIFAWKIKKNKTNPISIKQCHPPSKARIKKPKQKGRKNKQIKFYCSLQAKLNHHNFFSIFVPYPPPILSHKTTKFFTIQKTGKNLFYVLFHHHISPYSLCQPSTK